MSDHAVAHLDEIEEVNDRRCPFRRVRLHFGITSFAVNAWTGHDAGDRIINEHDESDEESQEELYLVQRGRATFELDGERVDAPTGTLVFARAGVKRTAFAEEAGTTIVAIGGTPGKAYEPSGWELWAPLAPLYDSGRYAEAADRGRELIETYPDYPSALQRGLLREPRGACRRSHRASPARARRCAAVAFAGCRRLRPGRDPRPARVQGAGGLAPSGDNAAQTAPHDARADAIDVLACGLRDKGAIPLALRGYVGGRSEQDDQKSNGLVARLLRHC